MAPSPTVPLTSGVRIGPYEIVAAIGSGGMGEVYKARDTRLSRDVAIKILPNAVAADPERLARFHREAQVLAALNHPNIAQIYGVEDAPPAGVGQPTIRALVMEFVEGPTLAERIAERRAGPFGPAGSASSTGHGLPVDEALSIAWQIAEALHAAHEKGIVHRDLKPANIKVRNDGAVKVLDFGLAKLQVGDAAHAGAAGQMQAALTNSPTITSPDFMTGVGVLLGTAPYMSPEQAKGRIADTRCDIWAFGCVLYEMLAGRRAFDGDDLGDTLAAVLRGQPDWDALPPDTPTAISTLLRRCLEKDRRARVADTSVALFLLREHAALVPSNGIDAAAAKRNLEAAVSNTRLELARVTRRWQLSTALLALLVGGAGWALWRQPAAVLKPLVRLDVDLGDDVSLYGNQGIEVVISPDGNRIVYVSNDRLYSRTLDQSEGAELKGTEGGFAPFFSPDGQAIGFFAARQLKTLTFDSGLITKVCDTGGLPRSGSWGDDGTIVAELGLDGGLSVVPAGGGTPVPLVNGAMPVVLPGSSAVLFSSRTEGIRILSRRDGRIKTLHAGTSPRFVPTSVKDGFLLFLDGTNLLAARFRLDTLELEGEPVARLDQIAPGPLGVGQFDVSSTGRAVFQRGTQNTRNVVIQWLTPTGLLPLLNRPGVYSRVAVSPSGSRIAYQSSGVSRDVWLYEPSTDTTTRLTFDDGELPRWSPDGRYIAYRNSEGLYRVRADGAGAPSRLTMGQAQFPMTFTPDGRQVIFQETVNGKNDIWSVRVPDDPNSSKPEPPKILIQGPFDERQPAISPDGRWLAYASDDTGEFQIYVRPFPNVDGGKWQVSSDGGGVYPIWSRTEKRLFFRNNDNQVLSAVYADRGDAFASERAQLWSQERLADFGVAGSQNFDLAPDGRRVAAIMPAPGVSGQDRRHRVVFLDNFLDELRRRVPAATR